MLKHLEDENLNDLIKNGLYLIDFYADWCGPCKMLGTVLEKMEDINIIKINTDAHPELAREYGIMTIPTLIFFQDGIPQKREIGFKTEEQIRNIIKNI